MTLNQPPDFPKQTVPIYKCDGEDGCKKLFSLSDS